MDVEVWLPLEGLGADAERVERALAGAPADEAERVLAGVEAESGARRASLLAARFALLDRRGDAASEAEITARRAIDALAAIGATRASIAVSIELAASLGASRARLDEGFALLDALAVPADDSLLSAARARARGGLLRARGDLRGSLSSLEAARRLADASGSAREVLRASNTLGVSYAALGVTALAREALETARELADVGGQRQSAAIAAGQLATLAIDEGDARLAARHLTAQRAISEHLGDTRGAARALSLLVEAHAELGDVRGARDHADRARALYATSPTSWTRLQALLATLYEAEGAYAAGDRVRADELRATFSDDVERPDIDLRVARARSAFVSLWDTGSFEISASISASLARLALSPRPTWVERALFLAVHVAGERGAASLVPRLAIRAAAVLERRAAASSRSLLELRRLAPDAAISRASALGRDLVLTARLALAPLDAFPALVLDVSSKPALGALDALVASLDRAVGPDGLLLELAPPSRARVVVLDPALAERAVSALDASPDLASLRRRESLVSLREDASLGLSLACREDVPTLEAAS